MMQDCCARLFLLVACTRLDQIRLTISELYFFLIKTLGVCSFLPARRRKAIDPFQDSHAPLFQTRHGQNIWNEASKLLQRCRLYKRLTDKDPGKEAQDSMPLVNCTAHGQKKFNVPLDWRRHWIGHATQNLLLPKYQHTWFLLFSAYCF